MTIRPKIGGGRCLMSATLLREPTWKRVSG